MMKRFSNFQMHTACRDEKPLACMHEREPEIFALEVRRAILGGVELSPRYSQTAGHSAQAACKNKLPKQ